MSGNFLEEGYVKLFTLLHCIVIVLIFNYQLLDIRIICRIRQTLYFCLLKNTKYYKQNNVNVLQFVYLFIRKYNLNKMLLHIIYCTYYYIIYIVYMLASNSVSIFWTLRIETFLLFTWSCRIHINDNWNQSVMSDTYSHSQLWTITIQLLAASMPVLMSDDCRCCVCYATWMICFFLERLSVYAVNSPR